VARTIANNLFCSFLIVFPVYDLSPTSAVRAVRNSPSLFVRVGSSLVVLISFILIGRNSLVPSSYNVRMPHAVCGSLSRTLQIINVCSVWDFLLVKKRCRRQGGSDGFGHCPFGPVPVEALDENTWEGERPAD